MLPDKIAFVDIETTGARATFDRIIEIGIVRIENNQLVRTYSTLINPDTHLPPEITMLTGITSADLENAPSFYQIKDEILEVLEDCVFVAHNVRFDYGFLRNEFKRFGISWASKHFCTVKLSRSLYPQHSHHNLDSIIERFGFQCANRHRAYDDAYILWEFIQRAQQECPEELFLTALDKAQKRPSLPVHLPPETLDELPETSGVYIFYGDQDSILYVGKSVNIHDRVLSHFSSDHTSSKEMKISQQIKRIETITTSGELGALLLEAHLIKKMQPLYNRALRMSRKLVVVRRSLTPEGYNSIKLEQLDKIDADDLDSILGIFRSQRQAKEFLIGLTKEYDLCEKLLGIEHSSGACFGYRLGRCKGACTQKESTLRYNLRFTLAFSKHKIRQWPFNGPIVIEESNPIEHTQQGFIIDRWCHIASLQVKDDHQQVVQNEYTFDLDAYKILNRYLGKSNKVNKIKLLSQEEFKRLCQA